MKDDCNFHEQKTSTRRSWYHMVLKRDGNEGCKAISAISSVPSFEKTNVKQDVWAKVLPLEKEQLNHKGDFFFSEINSAALVHCCKSQRGLRGDFSPLKSNHTLELAGIFRPALTSIGCSHLSKRTLGFFWGCNLLVHATFVFILSYYLIFYFSGWSTHLRIVT